MGGGDVPFKWAEACHDAFNSSKKCLAEGPILKYPNPEQLYTLFMGVSKYAWPCVLKQACTHVLDGKEKNIFTSHYIWVWFV